MRDTQQEKLNLSVAVIDVLSSTLKTVSKYLVTYNESFIIRISNFTALSILNSLFQASLDTKLK
jgi:hypothetical protein